LLSAGNVVYFGRAAEAVDYFGNLSPIPFKCPQDANPADFVCMNIQETSCNADVCLVDLTTLVGREDREKAQRRIDYLVNAYQKHVASQPPNSFVAVCHALFCIADVHIADSKFSIA